ncbi:MAG TPA: extracellular solute-binding protein, partial [Limnochordia bacterium]
MRSYALAGLLAAAIWLGGSGDARGRSIDVWHFWGPGSTVDAGFHAVADAFTERTGVSVNITPAVTGEKIKVAIAAGAPPDVSAAWDSPVILHWEGLVQPLTPLLRRGSVREADFWAPSWRRAYGDGELWGVPMTSDPNFGLAYNQDIFDAAGLPDRPPRTLDDVEAYQAKLVRRGPDNTLIQYGFIPWDMYGAGNGLMLWMSAFDGQMWDSEADRPTFTSPGLVRAIEWISDYAHRWHWQEVPKTPGPALFAQGFLGMVALGPWDLTYAGIATAGFRYSIGFMPVPAGTGVTNPTFVGGHNLIVPLGADNVED